MTIQPSKPVQLAPVIIAGEVVLTGRSNTADAVPATAIGTSRGPKVWAFPGPPPDVMPIGVAVGDSWLNTETGDLYRLDPDQP